MSLGQGSWRSWLAERRRRQAVFWRLVRGHAAGDDERRVQAVLDRADTWRLAVIPLAVMDVLLFGFDLRTLATSQPDRFGLVGWPLVLVLLAVGTVLRIRVLRVARAQGLRPSDPYR